MTSHNDKNIKDGLNIVVGAQNGDEGKGRITQVLLQDSEIVVRPNGGSNAQHEVRYNGYDIRLRHIPVGVIKPSTINIIGPGTVVNLVEIVGEINMLEKCGIDVGQLIISDQAHLVMPVYRLLNRVYEMERGPRKNSGENLRIGSSAQGFGPAMEHKAAKRGLRILDLENEIRNSNEGYFKERLRNFILRRAQKYITNFESEIVEIYDYDRVKEKQEFFNLCKKRTYAEELVRLLNLSIFENNHGLKKISKTNYRAIEDLIYEVSKFSYVDVNWSSLTESAISLVEEITGTSPTAEEIFFDEETNYNILSRAHSLLEEKIQTNVSNKINAALKAGKNILFEGAQGSSLDITHGIYPNVASSTSTVPGMLAEAGIGTPTHRAFGVTKPYLTTTGTASTPLPTEILDFSTKEIIKNQGNERDRRICWLDIVMLNNNLMINGITDLAITHLDALSGLDVIMICTAYHFPDEKKPKREFTSNRILLEKVEPEFLEIIGWAEDITLIKKYEYLPKNAKILVQTISNLTFTKVTILTVGPESDQTIQCAVFPETREQEPETLKV